MPARARSIASTPNAAASSGLLRSHGSSSWTTSAPRGHQVAELGVDRVGEGQRQRLAGAVVVVLGLLGQRERARAGGLDPPRGVLAQELEVPAEDVLLEPDRADHAGHLGGLAAVVHDRRRVVEVDPRERRDEVVRVALAADLAIRDDVDPGPLHVGDGRQGRRVLGVGQLLRGDAPDLGHAHPGDGRRQQLAIDQPVRLGIASDDGRLDQVLAQPGLLAGAPPGVCMMEPGTLYDGSWSRCQHPHSRGGTPRGARRSDLRHRRDPHREGAGAHGHGHGGPCHGESARRRRPEDRRHRRPAGAAALSRRAAPPHPGRRVARDLRQDAVRLDDDGRRLLRRGPAPREVGRRERAVPERADRGRREAGHRTPLAARP